MLLYCVFKPFLCVIVWHSLETFYCVVCEKVDKVISFGFNLTPFGSLKKKKSKKDKTKTKTKRKKKMVIILFTYVLFISSMVLWHCPSICSPTCVHLIAPLDKVWIWCTHFFLFLSQKFKIICLNLFLFFFCVFFLLLVTVCLLEKHINTHRKLKVTFFAEKTTPALQVNPEKKLKKFQ